MVGSALRGVWQRRGKATDALGALSPWLAVPSVVGARDSANLTNFGDELSGWWVLWRKWNPFVSKVDIPDMQDIASRLAYIRTNYMLEELEKVGANTALIALGSSTPCSSTLSTAPDIRGSSQVCQTTCAKLRHAAMVCSRRD
jgi:hypothetical protein